SRGWAPCPDAPARDRLVPRAWDAATSLCRELREGEIMNYQLLTFLTFALFGVLFVVVTVSVIGRLLRPSVRDTQREPAKGESYECGEPAIGTSWVRF